MDGCMNKYYIMNVIVTLFLVVTGVKITGKIRHYGVFTAIKSLIQDICVISDIKLPWSCQTECHLSTCIFSSNKEYHGAFTVDIAVKFITVTLYLDHSLKSLSK